MIEADEIFIDRRSLARVFTDPSTLKAIENVIQVVNAVPEAVNENTQGVTDAQAAADAAAADAAAAGSTAAAAAAQASDVAAAPILTYTSSAALSAERVLSGTGVTLDLSTPGFANLVIAVATILGYTPANKGGETFTGAVDVQSSLQCDSLRIDQAPSASVTAASHALPINLNGTTYYLKLSATP